jgi:hypothetical protein
LLWWQEPDTELDPEPREYPQLAGGDTPVEHAIETSKTGDPARRPFKERPWEVLYARGAGLDAHKEQVTACRRAAAENQVSREVRSFSTTAGLLSLAE